MKLSYQKRLSSNYPAEKRSLYSPLTAICLLAGLLSVGGCQLFQKSSQPNTASLDQLIDSQLLPTTQAFIKHATYRTPDRTNEAIMRKNMANLRDYISGIMSDFNSQQQVDKFSSFEWKKHIKGRDYWLFGYRIGRGTKKASIIAHLDTVPPGNSDWKPFEARIEQHQYRGQLTDFLVGRGAIDDKGPAVVSLLTLQSLAKELDGNPLLDDWQLEILFDTSEETGMSMPHYMKDPKQRPPTVGVVFDSAWCVRAEKGIERPIFTLPRQPQQSYDQLWIADLFTPPGPSNQIPDTATAIIKGPRQQLKAYAKQVMIDYKQFTFDDIDYRPAKLKVMLEGDQLILTTKVAGAQHGSVPHANRAEGANPLVSLANYLAGKVNQGYLAQNDFSQMTQFIEWMWGTYVFGEKHPQLLQAYDDVFSKDNGTTYAVTRVKANDKQIRLRVDIRYATGHQTSQWDGITEGFLPGNSRFKAIFTELTSAFNQQHQSQVKSFSQRSTAPDIRRIDGPLFKYIDAAYKSVKGEECPRLAIGGGTDAKGHANLLAVGPMFAGGTMGPPVNYHGVNEGAPINELKASAKILQQSLLNVMKNE
ncbi:M20/M25/M40 family metallo-hydrolase [Spartinivicinus poritis]|uniref:M20/M25/M40 family metallo-hydrolase n=1 Tax=Spartinivicinus poritis TaxID=2994640 RepID=A0ABT5UGV9_9GAMM|nr:M20/M25/M40 family metallo-hydrolase [Spartinivicinus sp. A2-2]MDE1465542.1 M20/M25/M40 family metallo-hydrolase [Spartinivicinus sp. A2-2]